MPHEPKVGKLPALTEAQKNRCRQMANAYEAHTPVDFMTIMREGIAAEREARKDEARAVELLRRLVWTHVQGINTHDAAIESMDAWRDATAYVAALQAEHGAAARDGEAK